LEKLFGKIASTIALCMDEREMRERVRISYFFSASYQFMSLRDEKNSFAHNRGGGRGVLGEPGLPNSLLISH
jgi:hypothetical protein